MTIRFSYKFSTLDNRHQFGIEFLNESNTKFETQYIRWVWFYLGQLLSGERAKEIYPYSVNVKTVKVYKFCNDARRQAHLIYKQIIKKVTQ